MLDYELVQSQYHQKCKTCGHENIRRHTSDDSVLLWSLYCIKCLENFLDKNIGKMVEEKT